MRDFWEEFFEGPKECVGDMPKKNNARTPEFKTIEYKPMSYDQMIQSLYSIRLVLIPNKVTWEYVLKEDRILMGQEIDSIIHELTERKSMQR